MKLDEMVLVTESSQGKETNFLASLENYIEIISEAYTYSIEEIACAVAGLYDTKKDPEEWKSYFMGNKTYHVRFCDSEAQLRGFLFGVYNEQRTGNKDFVFDEEQCCEDCFEVLRAYDIKTDGHSQMSSFVYRDISHIFRKGEMIHNMNGNDYRILEVLTPENLLLMSQRTGEICVGLGTKYMERYPKEGDITDDVILLGVSWSNGVYLGWNIMDLDFEGIQKEYGEPEKVETLEAYRDRLKKTFYLYQKIMDNELLHVEVRKAAQKSVYMKFGTGKEQSFLEDLQEGNYDFGFQEKSVERKEKTR